MKLGDIIEIEQNSKLVYLQYVKEAKDETRSERMKVFYEVYENRPENIESIIKDDFFFLNFPLKYAIKDKDVNLVRNIPLPKNFVFPQYFRTENAFGSGWRIMNDSGGSVVVQELSDDQKKLSPWGGWNIPLIFKNLESGWRLENWI